VAKALFVDTVHAGPTVSFMFYDSETVASDGLDRTIVLTPFRGRPPLRQLPFSLRCKG